MKAFLCIVSVVLLTFGSAPVLRAARQAPRPRRAIPNPHHHAKGEDVLKEVAPEIKIVEASVPENAELQNLLLNKSQEGCGARVYRMSKRPKMPFRFGQRRARCEESRAWSNKRERKQK